MPARVQAFPPDLPLILTAADAELARIAARRAELAASIKRLKPHSEGRARLIAKMRELTEAQLRLELKTGKAG